MNALKAYAAENSGSDGEEEEAPIEDVLKDPEEIAQKLGLTINPVSDVIPFASASQIAQCSQVAVFDPKTKELKSNPRYEELLQQEGK
uniref:Uncharacterized protein n=1 Tax=Panagrolaimus sp. ES5 TaxID=591445 RepID=A0AC34G6Z2_9BILA